MQCKALYGVFYLAKPINFSPNGIRILPTLANDWQMRLGAASQDAKTQPRRLR